MQSGTRRERAQTGQLACQTRLPIIPPILRRMRQSWTGGGRRHHAMGGSTVLVFSCGRDHRTVSGGIRPSHPTLHGAMSRVTIISPSRSFGHSLFSQSVQDGPVWSGSCHTCQHHQQRLVPSHHDPALCGDSGDGQGPFIPLCRAREALTRAGYPCQNYAGHSFRIGMATTAAAVRIPDSTIQALGQWTSTAFLLYIRTPRDRLAQLSASLALTTSGPRR